MGLTKSTNQSHPPRFEYARFPDLTKVSQLGIILFGGIGDLVCLTSALLPLRRRLPHLKVFLLSSPMAKEFFPEELVDDLIFDPEPFIDLAKTNKRTLVVNLHSTTESARISARLREEGVEVFGLLAEEEGFYIRGGIFHDILHRVFYVRFRDEYIASWMPLGRSALLSLCLGGWGIENPRVKVPASNGLIPFGRFVVMVPDANAPTRMWVKENWLELADMIWREFGLPTVFLSRFPLGGKTRDWVLDLGGKTSLGQACGVVSGAVAVVSNDTGMIHIAGALAKPTLVVCGPNNVGPEAKGRFLSIRYPVECSPCFRSHCDYLGCMKGLRPEYVLRAFAWLLKDDCDDLPKELVVGSSFEQDLDIFFDYHPLGVPYRDLELIYTNLMRWAWIWALIKEERINEDTFSGFSFYWDKFYCYDPNELSGLLKNPLSRLQEIRHSLLPVREKIGILIKKGGAITPKVAEGISQLLNDLPRELLYPWNYAVDLRGSALDLLERVLARAGSMVEFIKDHDKIGR